MLNDAAVTMKASQATHQPKVRLVNKWPVSLKTEFQTDLGGANLVFGDEELSMRRTAALYRNVFSALTVAPNQAVLKTVKSASMPQTSSRWCVDSMSDHLRGWFALALLGTMKLSCVKLAVRNVVERIVCQVDNQLVIRAYTSPYFDEPGRPPLEALMNVSYDDWGSGGIRGLNNVDRNATGCPARKSPLARIEEYYQDRRACSA